MSRDKFFTFLQHPFLSVRSSRGGGPKAGGTLQCTWLERRSSCECTPKALSLLSLCLMLPLSALDPGNEIMDGEAMDTVLCLGEPSL